MTQTLVGNSEVTGHVTRAVSSERAVQTGERLLSRVNSQVLPNSCFVSHPVATDPTLVPDTISLNVGVETLDRSQRQLT